MTTDLSPTDEFDTLEETAEDLAIDWHGAPRLARKEVKTPDGTVSAVLWGDSPARSILLHGRAPTQSARSWDGVALAWGLPTVAIDLPGHGWSDRRVDRRYTPRAIAPAVEEAASALTSTPDLVVGVSFGGLTAIALAALRPELFSALVLVDVLPWAPAELASAKSEEIPAPALIETFASQQDILESLLTGSERLSRAALGRIVARNTVQEPDGRWAWRFDPGSKVGLGDLDFPGLWSDLLAIEVPVLLVRGGQSPVVSDEAVAALEKGRPDVTVEIVADSGHEIHDEAPGPLAAIIATFADKIGGQL
jgi:pimeloyl-ACP methyl ester carboxylesterase